MKKIYIDGVQIHSNTENIGFMVKTPIQGLGIPELRNTTYDKPGEYGSFTSNQLYSGRLITLTGKVYSTTSLEDFESKRRYFQSLFRIQKDSTGVPVQKTLQFITMDNMTLEVYGYVIDFKMERANLFFDEFQISFKCNDYVISSSDSQLIILYPPSGGGAIYPVIYPVVYAAATGGAQSGINNGTENSFPYLLLAGQLTNPVITNLTTGKYMSLSLTIGSGETATVAMNQKAIVLNDSTPILQYKELGSDWWWFAPGSNTISLTSEDSADDGFCYVIWQDAYIGI